MFNEEDDAQEADPDVGVREPRNPKNPPLIGGAEVNFDEELVTV